MLMRWLAVMAIMGSAVGQRAQKLAAPTGPTGTVAGVLTCSDTQRAARFAQVALILKKTLEGGGDGDAHEVRQDSRKGEPPVVVMVKGATGVDGTFSIAEVPVGEYYAMGVMKGYRLPIAVTAAGAGAIDLEKTMAGFPLVHVAANNTTVVNVAMRRGAGVSGRVTFDDGSPGVGFVVNLEPADGVEALPGSHQFMLVDQLTMGTQGFERAITTNDRGQYRIAGVASGKYRVRAMMTVQGGFRFVGSGPNFGGSVTGGQQGFTVFAPGKFHKDEGQVVEVRGDEEDGDVDIRVALDTTHTVRGRVLAKEDQHPLKQGFVTLADASDRSFRLVTSVDGEGSYRFNFVPEGTYTLSVQGGDAGEETNGVDGLSSVTVTRTYVRMQVGVVVAEHDVEVDDILLGAKKAAANGPEN